tara:strand:+ start:9231 stop:9455 length:225 start_codon:yes stop_codon:yes gene_type:complete
MTLATFIKVKFGTQERLSKSLKLHAKTVNKWYNNDPKKLFMFATEIAKFSDTPTEQVIKMIEDRCDDVRYLKSK